jgi:O-6-methylguanine DNA methyltransferase
MGTDIEWIITEVDGKIASASPDYRLFSKIASAIASMKPSSVDSVRARKISTDELVFLSKEVVWDDLHIFGTSFQKNVLETLFTTQRERPRLMSYSEIASLCNNPGGVRPVAHALAVNPLAFIIPCHLVVPKESMDKIASIRSVAEASTLFKGSDLYLLDSIDVGEYAYGSDLKREFIKISLGK